MNTITIDGLLPIAHHQGLQLDVGLAREIGMAGMEAYAFAEPFAHTVIDQFLPSDVANELLAHFPAEAKPHDKNYEKGYGGQFKRQISPYDCDVWMQSAFAFFNSPAMLAFLEGLTNIKGLIPDPYFAGGGLHETGTGGMLGIHADFQVNEALQLRRRINVLIYLNKDWKLEYGGELELWDKKMQQKVKSVAPLFNRCVIFNTDADSFHGHPDPLTTPPDVTRKSIALYYYTAQAIENAVGESRHTLYVARPNDTPENIAQAKKLAAKREKRAKKKQVEHATGIINKLKKLFGSW